VPALVVFVDYDNVDPTFTGAGPVQLGRVLLSAVPLTVVARYESAVVRLYGGWRASGSPTTSAQRLVPEIVRGSPTIYEAATGPTGAPVRLLVELADRPIGWHAVLDQTLIKNRGLRGFRANPQLLRECVDIGACGMQQYFSLLPSTACANAGCGADLGHLLVRDEQKMVDTLLVADLAFQVFTEHPTDVVVVSSDADIWPGILLALRGGSNVVHIHPKPGGRTQPHLLQTLGSRLSATYVERSL
jgi:hypothetical protein